VNSFKIGYDATIRSGKAYVKIDQQTAMQNIIYTVVSILINTINTIVFIINGYTLKLSFSFCSFVHVLVGNNSLEIADDRFLWIFPTV
jgi:hypothetical protein